MDLNNLPFVIKQPIYNPLDQYLEKWTKYTVASSATWVTVTITDALPNSLIQIVCVNKAGNNDMGVRQIGSVINRRVMSVANSSLTLVVKTDSLKQVQLYASSAGSVDFYFSAQL